jgi:hypothetical protein
MLRSRGISYLETDKSENVHFYQRFGFSVIAETELLGARKLVYVATNLNRGVARIASASRLGVASAALHSWDSQEWRPRQLTTLGT